MTRRVAWFIRDRVRTARLDELAFEWSGTEADKQSFSLNTTVGDKHHDLGDRRLDLLSLAVGDLPEARLRIDATP